MDFQEKVLRIQELVNSFAGSPVEAIALSLFVAVNTNDLTIRKESFSVGIDQDLFKVTIKKEKGV